VSPEPRPCFVCGTPTRLTYGGILTPEQQADNKAWHESLSKYGYHTGHPPHLVLPPSPACLPCITVLEVMGS